MALFWQPDTCPASPCCVLEVTQGQSDIVRPVRLCEFHRAMLETSGGNEKGLFAAIKSKNREKNGAVACAAQELGVPSQDVQWSIDADDTLRITVSSDDAARVKAAIELTIGAGKVVIANG